MDLQLEQLEDLETPYSNDFWEGVAIGAGLVGLAFAIAT